MIRATTPIFSIVIAILIFFFVIQPKFDEIKLLRTETDEYNAATAQYAAFNAKVQELILKRDSVKISDRDRLDLLIPEKINDTRLLVDVEAIAKKNNVFLVGVETSNDNIDPSSFTATNSEGQTESEIESSNDLLTSEITFTLIGEYFDFKNFLRDIETSITLMHITKIHVAGNSEKFKLFNVTVRTYALPDSGNNN